MHPELQAYLWNGLALLGVILSPFLLVIALRAARYLGKVLKADPSEVAVLEWAARQGVLAIEERSRKHLELKGDAKKLEAIAKARSLAPDGLQKHTDEKIGVVVDAQVHQLLHSIPPAPSYSLPPPPRMSLPPPDR